MNRVQSTGSLAFLGWPLIPATPLLRPGADSVDPTMTPLRAITRRTRIPTIFVVFGVWWLAIASPALAQAESNQKGELDEVDQELIEAAIKLADYVGMNSPKRVDPILAPDSWPKAITGAAPMSAGDILESVTSVRLQNLQTPAAQELLKSSGHPWRPLLEAIHRRGKSASPRTDVLIRFTLNLQTAEFNATSSTEGQEVYMLDCLAELSLPARVVRGAGVDYVDITLARGQTFHVAPGEPTAEEVAIAVDATIGELFRAAESAPARSSASVDSWVTWMGDSDAHELRLAAFRDSFAETDDDLASGIAGIGTLRDLWSGFRALDASMGAGQREPSDTLTRDWRQRMEAAGIRLAPSSPHQMTNEIWTRKIQAGPRLDAVGWSSYVAVTEPDGLAVLDRKFVRVQGHCYRDAGARGFFRTTDRERAVAARVHGQIDRFTSAAIGGEQARAGLHPNTPAVVAYLKTRQFFELPEPFLDEIGHRIATRLSAIEGVPSELRAQWLIERDGAPYFDLWRVGNHRTAELVPGHVQQAINRAIDDLERSDPMGIYAFDSVFWDGGRGPRPVFPEGYAEYLSGPRPSGTGALRRAHVSDLYHMSTRLIPEDISKEKRAELMIWSYENRELLAAQKILVGEYVPSGAALMSIDRHFLYGNSVADWEALKGKLPDGVLTEWLLPHAEQAPYQLKDAHR